VAALRLRGAEDLVARAIHGEWDGTVEEAQEWFEREGRALIEQERT